MPSSKEILRCLRRIGYVIEAQRGKGSHTLAHFEYEKETVCVTTVQRARDIPKGTLASIKPATALTDPQEFDRCMRDQLTRQEYVGILLRQRVIALTHHER